MKNAVRFYSTAFGLFFGIILFLYLFGTSLLSEIFSVLSIAFVVYVFIVRVIRKPILKSKIKIRLQNINWVFFIGFVCLGMLKIWQGFKNPDLGVLVFGILKDYYVVGFYLIVLGIIFYKRVLIIDNMGVFLNDWVNTKLAYSQIERISLIENTIEIKTEAKEYRLKTQKLSELEIAEINKRIEEYKSLELNTDSK